MTVVNIGLHRVCKVSKIISFMFFHCLETDSLGSQYVLNRPLIIHIGTVCPPPKKNYIKLGFSVLHNTEEIGEMLAK